MARNPERLYIKDGKIVDVEGNEVDQVTPGPSQLVPFDPDSDEAKAKSQGEDVEAKSLGRMTHDELDTYAAAHGVDLTGATTKQEKIDAINTAGVNA